MSKREKYIYSIVKVSVRQDHDFKLEIEGLNVVIVYALRLNIRREREILE